LLAATLCTTAAVLTSGNAFAARVPLQSVAASASNRSLLLPHSRDGIVTASLDKEHFIPAPKSLVDKLTQIPQSEFNSVGVTSTAVTVSPPVSVSHQPPLTWINSKGRRLPSIFYYGAEFCPFCAAERWPLIIALSRFGKFNDLGEIASNSTDEFANTPSFTFLNATYTSSYINFSPIEAYNIDEQPLQTATPTENHDVTKYDSAKYIPGLGSSGAGSIPFISINNRFFAVGAEFSPGTFSGVSRAQIASLLGTTSSPLTQAILTSANELTAAICVITQERPGSVCSSAGTRAADQVDKIGSSSLALLTTSSSDTWLWIILAFAVLVSGLAVVVVWRRRQRSAAPSKGVAPNW
jgi:thiol-disulfide isomerase/thioredoxin